MPGAPPDGRWHKGDVVVPRGPQFITRDSGSGSVRRAQPGTPGESVVALFGFRSQLAYQVFQVAEGAAPGMTLCRPLGTHGKYIVPLPARSPAELPLTAGRNAADT